VCPGRLTWDLLAVDGPRGQKRKQDEVTGDDSAAKAEDGDGAIKGGNEDVVTIPEEDEEPDADPSATDLAVGKMQVNADGSVVQEDKVKLYEPGYRDRYYRQKFGVEPSDEEFRKKCVRIHGDLFSHTYRRQGDQVLC
jgi:5'-3' exoribonuclease 2